MKELYKDESSAILIGDNFLKVMNGGVPENMRSFTGKARPRF
jgi:hypothetical protein